MTNKTWKTWTVKELRKLEELCFQGLTAAEIAKELNRTRASIKCRLQTKKMARPSRSILKWLELLNQPHTITSAAAAMGVTKGAVKTAKRRLRRMDYDVPDAQHDKEARQNAARKAQQAYRDKLKERKAAEADQLNPMRTKSPASPSS